MPRSQGDKNKGANEYSRLYEQMVVEENINPVRVLFKLMKSRVQTVRLQAAATALKYRFPTQAAAKLEVEQAKQMVMTWEETIVSDPPALTDGSDPDDRREFPRHDIEDVEVEEIPL